jgi:hypothetical protein
MADTTLERVKAAQRLYTKPLLSVYDWLLLGLYCRFIWGCPRKDMLDLYNQHISSNHLDVGVGTGYFLDRCKFPKAEPRLALMDLNPNCLEVAGKRLARYSPEIYRSNVLDPINIKTTGFESIGMMNLLHCLPGDFETKGVVFENLKALLNPGGVVFGSTILYGSVRRNLLATCTLILTNRLGLMTNLEDSADGLKASLAQHFSENSVNVIGCMALFWAR